MAGSKTRFGFFTDGGEPQKEDELRAASTVIGRDRHLQIPAGFVLPKLPISPKPLPQAPLPPSPYAAPVALMPEEVTEQIPTRRGNRPHQSRIARFLGRWTKSGRFQTQSPTDALDNDPLKVPRDTTGRNVLLFLIVALLTFLVTIAIVKLRQRYALTGPAAVHLVVAEPRDHTKI
jgi:hypothetical protein